MHSAPTSALAALLAIEPVAQLRRRPAPPTQYVLLLLDASGATSAAHLYLAPPGQLPALLAQLPTTSQGLGACFAPSLLPAEAEPSPTALARLVSLAPIPLAPGPAAEITFLLTSLAQQVAGDQGSELTRAYLHALLLRCLSLRPSPPAQAAPGGLLVRFRHLLEQRFRTCKSVASYARELCVTPNHLSERIRQETGRPAGEHIRQRVMQEARHLLAAPDVQLKQVAYELGFEDTAHFGKLFKRCHGMSFSDFRARQADGRAPAGAARHGAFSY
jgi:AraC-like DNA-binding protein